MTATVVMETTAMGTTVRVKVSGVKTSCVDGGLVAEDGANT